MTDEQINAAITEAIDADPHWKCAKNYCRDLNAMHGAEKVLTKAQWEDFVEYLSNGFFSVSDVWKDVCHATARERAEAFLRTLGKWNQSGDATEMVEEEQK